MLKEHEQEALLGLEESLRHVWEDVDEVITGLQSPLIEMMERYATDFVGVLSDSQKKLVENDKRSRVPQFLPEVKGLLELRDNLYEALLKVVSKDQYGGWGVIYAQLEQETGIPSAVFDAFSLSVGKESEVRGIKPLLTEEGYLTVSAYGAAAHLVEMELYSEEMFEDLPDIDPDVPRVDKSMFEEE